ncbi:mitochondrial transcription rescue factor 1 [Nilaparvata lugens]|uniref:mitochondrial transcription rescue factor 1 n=1 Tax=Nilaparvata lugens TaxID=108931 RepID=UPI00193E028D|nr:mitochondrial transcription rescue factor 1 [Nilaparvata lugens]
MMRRLLAKFNSLYQENLMVVKCLTRVTPKFKIIQSRRNVHFIILHSLKSVPLLTNHKPVYSVDIAQRNYSTKKINRNANEEESDSDEDDDLLDKFDKTSKVIKTSVTSMRLDALIKSGLALSRNKIDNLFYEGRLRLNGSKITKKSQRLNVGDEVDIIKGLNPNNDNLLNISRIEILSAAADEDEDAINVKIRRIKQLSVENYEKHPWVEVTQ